MRADVVSHCLLSFFRLPFMRDSIFVIAFLQDTLGDIFFSFFFPLHVPPELSKSLTPQKERPVRMKSFGHSQVAPHIPSQLFRMMQIGSAGVGVAVALYHRCCWMVAEPAVGHTVSRPFPSVSRKERSETMHFTVSAPSLRPSFHTPYLM